jgi:signal transduction histidine kinase
MQRLRAAGFRSGSGSRNLESWSTESHNEIQQLGSVFSDMLAHIDGQFKQLQQMDDKQRTLLADLSHDLRTPLASLQGYVETLALNTESLSEADRKRFVDISLKNARNLKRLLDQIFELAYIEDGQVSLDQESFPLGELLHDVLEKFSLMLEEKNITVTINPRQFDYRAFADIGKLERVLSNLLENAIRHTPNNGEIEVDVSTHNEHEQDRLRVDIRDSGIGISEQEIAFIFDARYQTSNNKADDSLHAGLGLAISRKLMALLDSDLRVESQLGKGSCFSFDLKMLK